MMRMAVLWSGLNFVVSQGASVVIFLIIAARISPEIFGVVALAAVAADFVSMEGRYAAMDTIIQSGKFDKRSLNAAFTSFLALVGVTALALIVLAPVVGDAYQLPLIATFMPLFALMLLPVPWIAVMDALMMRDLRYRQTTERGIAATLIGGAIGVAMAFSPWAIWALLAQRLASLVIQTGLLYHYTRWLPGFAADIAAGVDFARRFLVLWLINTLIISIARITLIVFGLRFDAVTVGLMRSSNRITETVQGPIITPLMGLWFPLMAKVKSDVAAEREVYTSIIRAATIVTLPAFTLLAITAPDLIGLVFSQEYAGVAPILQAAAVTMLLIPVLWFNNVAFNAMGMRKVSLIYTIALVVSSFVTLAFSDGFDAPTTLLIMAIPAAIVGVGGNIVLNKRLQQTNLAYYAGLAPAVLATLAMAVAAETMNWLLAGWPMLARFVIANGAGVIAYGGWLVLFHRGWLMGCVRLILEKRKQPAAEAAQPA